MTDPRSRLLFDGESADFFKMAIEEGEIALSTEHLPRARAAALGAGFVARLPALPQARMDELLDLRSD